MGYKIFAKTLNMSREDWLKQRRLGIGGSDAGAIAGLNKYKSAFALYMDKIGMGEEEQKESEPAYWGNTLEDIVAQEFTKRTGLKTKRINAILQHEEHEFMLANLDRVIVGKKWGLECKTTGEYSKDQWLADEMPPSYLLQIQHYLAVTGFEKFFVAVLIGGQTFTIKEIHRDEELIKYLIDLEKDFWENHVLEKVPPAVDGSESSEETLKKLYPESIAGSEVVLPFNALELIKERTKLKVQIKELSLKCDECENQLKSMMEQNESGLVDKFRITWKTFESSRLDTKRIRMEEPDIFEKYVNKVTQRKFDIKEIKAKEIL